ncbi:MAG: RdgB/HAM1 family non-canonical purine NTP pyrophosphatase [Betaproteobacteria bacterium]|nr:RdgB/HAM1 family non-canonical purine NTP pyrophosphatase [Betaproteobacteria bacterium]
MKRIVIASNNPGKLREFREMLAPLGIEIVPQAALGVPEADEPHATFVENALAKARHASRISGMPAFADDSGICVAALSGEPGVHSARFANDVPAGASREREDQDRRNNAKLIALLKGQADRRAHYYCVIVLARRADDPEPLIVEGRWHGEVIDAPRGTSGFGYDPYFYLPEFRRTAAELSSEEKNAVSHRGQALAALIARLREARVMGNE